MSLPPAVLEKVQKDIEKVKESALAGEFLKDIGLEDELVKLSLSSAKKSQLSITITEGYPNEELIVFDGEDYLPFYGDLEGVLGQLKKKYGSFPLKRSLKKSKGGDGEEDEEDWGSDWDSDGEEDWLEEDDDFGPPEEATSGEAFVYSYIDPSLSAAIREKVKYDVQGVQKRFGRAGHYMPPEQNAHIIRLVVDTSYIDKFSAAAYGVSNMMPVIINLTFDWQYINQAEKPPEVEIVQSSDTDLDVKNLSHAQTFSLKWYLQNRLNEAFKATWKKYHGSSSVGDSNRFRPIEEDWTPEKEKMPPSSPSPTSSPKPQEPNKGKDKTEQKVKRNKKSKKDKKKKKKDKKGKSQEASTASLRTKYPAELGKLLTMGINRKLAILALDKFSGDSERAADFLMDESNVASLLGSDDSATSLASETPTKAELEELADFFAEGPFLERVVDYMSTRLRTCTSFCLICDDPLEYMGAKPNICSKELCTTSFATFGQGFSLVTELQQNPEIVDLMICMTAAAGKNPRGNGADVFNPYPTYISYEERDKHATLVKEYNFMNDGRKNITEVGRVCDLIPGIAEMATYEKEAELKTMLEERHPLAYKLIRWTVQSCRTYLAPLPPDKLIKEMKTQYQFVLLSDNPAKEALFKRRRAQIAARKGGRGSFYVEALNVHKTAFHGSAVGNWHCICRVGLKNYSKTEYMSAGAAYGSGIYLAINASASFGYTRSGPAWTNTSFNAQSGSNSQMACIALCEVLDTRGDKGCQIHENKSAFGGIYVVADETLVVTRYFFVYPGHLSRGDAKSHNLKLPADLYS